ncbi:hypothetical protein [Roseateles violae]|uniref:LafX n=1 Tax=Roseateles violae TaxID=3058042 RepID=A0ABT8DTD6_9BURK|nr:hypothetical protein [Pelomonas sp. PFR6]MDN3921567.1 hypothetical protein [Pelomonas sp. PFR6]
MDKQAQMLGLAQRLQHASSRRDWQALGRIDAELAAQARQWEGQSFSAGELRALAQLRQAHGDASAQCRAELKGLEQTLEQINSRQGRWQAYSQSNNWEDSR